MLGLTLNAKTRAAPYTQSVHAFVDGATGAFTGSDVGATGLDALTFLPPCLDRSSVVITQEIRRAPRPGILGPASGGTPEPTSFRLRRRPAGDDALSDLIGKEVKGLEAVLWETGTLEGVDYTWPNPLIHRRGVLAAWDMSYTGARGTIQAPPVAPSEPALRRYPGWGTGVEYDGAASTVRWVVWDPSGDWTISVLHLLPVERWNSSSTTRILDNDDIQISRIDRTYRVKVKHATTDATVTSGDMPRPERLYMVTARYTASTKTVELLVDGVSRGTSAGTGAVTQSGLAWAFGSNQAQGALFDETIMGEHRFFSAVIDDDTLAVQERHALIGDETDLHAYLDGETSTGNTTLFDKAQVNAVSPLDGTITSATPATMSGGGLHEQAATSTGDRTVAQGAQMQWLLGRSKHVLCRPIDTQPGGGVFQVCDPLRGVQDFINVYEGGNELSITHRVTSWLALYAVTLAASGDCAVYPQGGAVLLHTRTEGAITADVMGGGPGMRALSLDGVDDQVDFGTGLNSKLIADFSISGDVAVASIDTSESRVLGNVQGLTSPEDGLRVSLNFDSTSGTYRFTATYLVDSGGSGGSAVVNTELPGPNLLAMIFLITADFTISGSDTIIDLVLYIDGAQVDTDQLTVTTTLITASGTAHFVVGADWTSPSTYSNFFGGTVSNLAIFSEVKDLAFHQLTLHAPLVSHPDQDGVAVDMGGGIVKIPMANHPFTSGEDVTLAGFISANYLGNFTLQSAPAGETEADGFDNLYILATHAAETFTGAETTKDAALDHAWPGDTWEFSSTLSDEGNSASVDGTVTGATYVGGIAPTSPRSLAKYLAVVGGVRYAQIDLTGASAWPSNPLDWNRQTG